MSPVPFYRVVLAALATSGGVIVLASSRWAAEDDPVLPAASAIGWLLLAAAGAVVATANAGRRLVGLLVVGTAAATALACVQTGEQLGGWGSAILAACLLAAACGVTTLVLADRWPVMSSRFGRATAADGAAAPGRTGSDLDAWHALDRGEDPTDPSDGTQWPHERESR